MVEQGEGGKDFRIFVLDSFPVDIVQFFFHQGDNVGNGNEPERFVGQRHMEAMLEDVPEHVFMAERQGWRSEQVKRYGPGAQAVEVVPAVIGGTVGEQAMMDLDAEVEAVNRLVQRRQVEMVSGMRRLRNGKPLVYQQVLGRLRLFPAEQEVDIPHRAQADFRIDHLAEGCPFQDECFDTDLAEQVERFAQDPGINTGHILVAEVEQAGSAPELCRNAGIERLKMPVEQGGDPLGLGPVQKIRPVCCLGAIVEYPVDETGKRCRSRTGLQQTWIQGTLPFPGQYRLEKVHESVEAAELQVVGFDLPGEFSYPAEAMVRDVAGIDMAFKKFETAPAA